MRKYIALFLTCIAFIFSTIIAAQPCGNSGPSVCVAGNNLTQPGFSPPSDSLPCAVPGVYYDQIIRIRVPTTVTSGGSTYNLNWIKITTLNNLPCGLCWASDRTTDTFRGGTQHCIRVTGVTWDAPGQYLLNAIVDANVQVPIIGAVTQSGQNLATQGMKYYLRVQNPNTGTCAPVDTLASSNTAGTVGAKPAAAISANGSTTFCAGGSVGLSATVAGAQYMWYRNGTLINGATAQTYTANQAGSYQVRVIKNCKDSLSSATTVTVHSPPNALVTPAGPVIMCSGNSQTLSASPTGAGITYQWYNGTSIINGQTASTFNASASGNYNVSVTQNGCGSVSNSVNVQVSGNAPQPVITATAANICAGQLDTLDAGAGYTSYLWSHNLGNHRTAVVSAAGTYSVTVSNGICTGSSSINIGSIPNTPTPTVSASGPTTFCAGGNVTLTSSSANNNVWSTGETTNAITISQTTANVSVTVNGQCNSATSQPINITVLNAPNAQVSPAGPVVICGGGSQTLTATPSGATAYQWLKNSVPISGETAPTFSSTTSGNYACLVTVGNCSDTSNVVQVQITTGTLTPIITSNQPALCPGAVDTLDAGSGYTSYAWSGGGNTRFKTVSTPGIYSVTVMNGSCTGTASYSVVTGSPTPTPTISTSGSTTFCSGGSVTLTSSATSNNTWSTGATSNSITVSQTTSNITVTTTGVCGTATSAPISVTVNAYPNAHISPSGSALMCSGEVQTFTATPSGGSYVWLKDGYPMSGQSQAQLNVTTPGNYQVVVRLNGCADTSNTTNLQVQPPPQPIITASANPLCTGSTSTLDVGAGYSSYQWSSSLGTGNNAIVNSSGTYTVTVQLGVCSASASINISNASPPLKPSIQALGNIFLCDNDSVELHSSAPTGNLWSTNEINRSILVKTAGNYFVTVSNACGSSTSDTIVVTHGPKPIINLGPDSSVCAGQSITLSAQQSIPATYTWSTGATTPIITATTTNLYRVTVQIGNCKNDDDVLLSFNPKPTASFTNNGAILTATTVQGATYQWLINGTEAVGETNQTYTITSSGAYAVVVTLNGCSNQSPYRQILIGDLADSDNLVFLETKPNPTNGIAQLRYSIQQAMLVEITLTDNLGRKVADLLQTIQSEGIHELPLDITHLPASIYNLTITTPQGRVVRKLVKQ